MIEVVAALIARGERFLICQRPENKKRALLWEYPGGKIEPGETNKQALIRECREELGVELIVGKIFTEVRYGYPDVTVHLVVYRAEVKEGEPEALEHNRIEWITAAELRDYDFCSADTAVNDKSLKESRR